MDSRDRAVIRKFKELDAMLSRLEERVDRLADKCDVTEEHTCENYNRLTEIEEWKEKVDDELEIY